MTGPFFQPMELTRGRPSAIRAKPAANAKFRKMSLPVPSIHEMRILGVTARERAYYFPLAAAQKNVDRWA